MNFANFQKFRTNILREQGDILDCAQTNLYAAFSSLVPPVSLSPQGMVHRCHLAAEWAALFGLPSDFSLRALISCGVRDSLALLFRHYARRNVYLWLPSDIYPAYGELARAAGLKPHLFSTLPGLVWPSAKPAPMSEILVVSNPLKPLGRWLTGVEVDALTAWLSASVHRRLLLDTVYTFDTAFHPMTLRLLATDQTILLHSLTKGWLHPQIFGVALVPESDIAELAPAFRSHPPPQTNLVCARELISRHSDMPQVVAAALAKAELIFRAAVAKDIALPAKHPAPGYLTVVAGHWAELLETTNVLGIPASVFGSSCENLTILSSLSFSEYTDGTHISTPIAIASMAPELATGCALLSQSQ